MTLSCRVKTGIKRACFNRELGGCSHAEKIHQTHPAGTDRIGPASAPEGSVGDGLGSRSRGFRSDPLSVARQVRRHRRAEPCARQGRPERCRPLGKGTRRTPTDHRRIDGRQYRAKKKLGDFKLTTVGRDLIRRTMDDLNDYPKPRLLAVLAAVGVAVSTWYRRPTVDPKPRGRPAPPLNPRHVAEVQRLCSRYPRWGFKRIASLARRYLFDLTCTNGLVHRIMKEPQQ